MWPDNETDRDFLNFGGVAATVAEIIVQAAGKPISIGVSGAWGVGKSSMIKLIRRELEGRKGEDLPEFVFVEFNAWLYQGYDDARASLLEVIATALEIEAGKRKKGVEKARELLKRVDWLRAAKLAAGSALALAPMALGLPPIGALGDAVRVATKAMSGDAKEEDTEGLDDTAGELGSKAASLWKPNPDSSPPKEIHAIRKCFEEALSEMGITLTVLIDDLDRCLPQTTISTLEAIRLFLFLRNTAFVIAADDTMIKYAVRRHFEGIDKEADRENLIISYFDKLVQIPIRVPPLGTQEVRAYLMMLFVEGSSLQEEDKEALRLRVCQQLGQSWRGQRVDRAFMQSLRDDLPPALIARLDSADRLAPLMTSASRIAGNPRLIKRFLNALWIRMAISRTHGVGVDEAALAKLLLFERCGDPLAYAELVKAINEDAEGRPRFLAEWERAADAGEELKLQPPWDDAFVREWLVAPPSFATIDLRGALYVSREHTPLISPGDRLSSESAQVLDAMLQHPDMSNALADRLRALPRPDLNIIMDRLLERARQEQEWGTPAILDACIAVAAVDAVQSQRLAAFMRERPHAQINASIVPKIADEAWAQAVLDAWHGSDVAPPVKRAITQQRKKA